MRAMRLLFTIALCYTVHLTSVAPNTVVATIPTGVTPAGIAVTPDGKFAYVANNNNYGLPNEDSVSVLNLTTNTLATTISDPSFSEPYTVTINAAGTKAYITNSNAATVSVIDIATNAVSAIITGFDGPSGFAIMPNGLTAYVNNYGGPILGSGNGVTVRVVDLITNTIVGPAITVDQAPAALAITPDGAFVYVANYVDGNPGTGTVNVIRTSDNTVIATIPGFSGPFAIAITPDGAYAYVTNFGSNDFEPYGTKVTVISTQSNSIVATIDNFGIQPAGLGITPDGRYAYVSNYNTLYAGPSSTNLTAGQGTVNIIDIATNTILPPVISVDESPANIAISPNGAFAYVSNYTSNTVNVIALPTFTISAQGCMMQNLFLTQRDLINKLTWSANGSLLPVSYAIYRDAELTDFVASMPATKPLQYFDHNRIPGVIYTYYIVGTNSVGTTSAPVAVTVTARCS